MEKMAGSFPVRVKTTGRAWKQENRYGSLIGRNPAENESLVDGFMRETDGADWVKLVNSGLNSLKTYGRETVSQFSAEEIGRLVEAAGGQGKKVMVHANGVLPVEGALRAGCHSIEHGFFMGRKNMELMAEKGAVWVPTVFTMKAYGENCRAAGGDADIKVIRKNLEHQIGQMALARELGVTIALGTDSGSLGVLHGESVVEEMKLLKKAGFTLPEIVQCATGNGARLLGIEEFGLLRKGKPATFLVSRGTPGQLPRKLAYLENIYIDGLPSELYRKNPVKNIEVITKQ
jgi:imidazolonepropionase-like amidohydrolase